MWGAAEWQALAAGAVQVAHPRWLALGLAAVAALALWALWRGPNALEVASTQPPRGWRAWLRGLSPDVPWILSVSLRAGALGLVCSALAGPVGLIPETPAGGSGIDLVVALDASGSMAALDAELDGRRVTRLDLASRVVAEYVKARPGDRIGLVVFGARAFTQTPLTVDHRLLLESLERVEIGIAGDATAIGEAIGLATRRLRVAGATRAGQRVLMLITDGRHNSGRLAPETAAQIAALHGVRIHTVGIGTSGRVPFQQGTPGQPLRFERVDLDRETLQDVAATTGGRFFHAEHPEDLAAITAEIDRLEARPHAAEPRYRRGSLAGLACAGALGLLLCEAVSSQTLWRRLP